MHRTIPLPTTLPPLAFMDLAPAQISEAIRRMEGTPGDFAVPLWRGSLAGEYRIAVSLPGGRLPARVLDRQRPPTCIILSADPDFPAPTPPPTAFPKLSRYLDWAASVIVHATGGTREHYTTVAAATVIMRRILLIETATVQEDAWMALVQAEAERREKRGQRLPRLCWSATPRGGVHPVQEGIG
ncbi:hypothetical protein [Roseomonas populi]|uniref:Uncharacterized protein n=1 Tax=Roseomonas populi TaxID=3121582 RepID=A0ABT1WXS0_9PROT|nr:hypothetical protein [Roseomonas pecuniae]MCR0980630.1 hypothetical protein [Roseomonas pecuniae]